MKILSKNLQMLLVKHDLRVSELARLINIAQPVLYRMTTGETNNPKVATLSPIANYFGISISQLIGDEPIPEHIPDKQSPPDSTWHHIPVILWEDALEWPKTSHKEYDRHIASNAKFHGPGFGLVMHDTTMRPIFPEESLLLFDTGLKASDRDYVLVQIGDDKNPVFKQLLLDGSDHYLKPINPEFKTQLLDKQITFRILGVLIESRMNFYSD